MYVCWDAKHIPRYMGRTSIIIKCWYNNSSCCFFRLYELRTTVTWGIRHIDEGFLIWIIPSTYLSHEVVNWAYTTDFACILFYSVLLVLLILCCFLSLEDSSGYMNSGYGDVSYMVSIYMRVSLFGLFLWYTNLTAIWAYVTGFAIFTLIDVSLPAHECMYSWHSFQYMLFDSDLSIHVCMFMHVTWHSSYY